MELAPVELRGTYDQVADSLPSFYRRPYALYTEPAVGHRDGSSSGMHPFLDEVVKIGDSRVPSMPMGPVSKTYKLVQHQDIFETAVRALDHCGVNVAMTDVHLALTQLGARMALRFVFPEPYNFDPGDSFPLHLRFECFNSVDGSSRLTFLMSWCRLVCTNGLMARVAGVRESIIHTERAKLPDLEVLIKGGIESMAAERSVYGSSLKQRIEESSLRHWVDTHVKDSWGALAAARTYLICRTGHDGVFDDPFDQGRPSEKAMRKAEEVPGSPPPSRNAYAISQALAWIARKRLDPREQLDYMRRIPALMERLVA